MLRFIGNLMTQICFVMVAFIDYVCSRKYRKKHDKINIEELNQILNKDESVIFFKQIPKK